MVGPDENLHSGDEHESRIMDFFDMVASVQRVDMDTIRESQQTDRFASQMMTCLLKEVLPTDELEILKVISHAPFYAVSDGILIRVGEGKELVGKVEGQKVHGPPIKRVYVPEGSRPQCHIVHAVHEELGHAGQTNTSEVVESMFDWPTMHRDTVRLVKHCSDCQFHAPKAPSAPI